jgi:hypothetical protein
MPIPKKSLTGPQHPANAKPSPATHGPTKVANVGSGQTWINLTKKEVDDYQLAHPQSQDKEVRRPSLGKFAAAIRWLIKYPFRH